MHFGWRGCRKNAYAPKMLQTNVAHSYNLEFLDFVRGGSTKPGIVRQMDQLDLETELKNNQKKNWKTIDKLTQSMQSDHIEQFEDFFAIKK